MKNLPSTWINPNWIPKRFPLAKIPYTPNFETIGEVYTNWQAQRPRVSPQQVKSILIDNLFKNSKDKIDDLGKALNATKVKPLNPVLEGASALGALYGLGAGVANYDREKAYLNNPYLSDEDKDTLSKYAMRTGRAYIGNTLAGGIAGAALGGPAGILPGAATGALLTTGADILGKYIMDKKGIPYNIIDDDGEIPNVQQNTTTKQQDKKELQPPESILPEASAVLGINNSNNQNANYSSPKSSVEQYILNNANPNVVYTQNGTPIPLDKANLNFDDNNDNPVLVKDMGTTTSNATQNYSSPSPSNDNNSLDMLATLMLMSRGDNNASFFPQGGIASSGSSFNYNDYLTPMEQNMLNSIQSSQLSNPDELRRLVNDYYNAQDLQNRTTAYRQQLGYKGDVPRDTTELERLLGENKFAKELLDAQNTLYNNVMKRADALRMAQQYGIPYSAVVDNMNGVMQWLINPYITSNLKRQEMPLETLQKIIETTITGEQNRKTERVKGEEERKNTELIWGNYRIPLEEKTLSSLERRNDADNDTRRRIAYVQAQTAEMNAKNKQYLTQLGLPVDYVKAISNMLMYVKMNSPEYFRTLSMIKSLTGMSIDDIKQNVEPMGDYVNPVVLDDNYDWIGNK